MTSNMPSSSFAFGATRIPDPKCVPFAASTIMCGPSRVWPSIRMRIVGGRNVAIDETVRHLVRRAVPANGDDAQVPIFDGVRRKTRRLTWCGRRDDVDVDARRAEIAREPREQLRAGAIARSWVHDRERALACHAEGVSALLMASCSSSE